MTRLPVKSNPDQERFPLPPQETASLECLLNRLHPIYKLLLKKRFTDAAASRAVDAALTAGQKALASGKAACMSDEHRAGWLWKVALNAARKAAKSEPRVMALRNDDVACPEMSEVVEVAITSLHAAIDQLPIPQKQAIEIHGLQQHSLRKAARRLGVVPATVANRFQRGLERLARILGGNLEVIGKNPQAELGAPDLSL